MGSSTGRASETNLSAVVRVHLHPLTKYTMTMEDNYTCASCANSQVSDMKDPNDPNGYYLYCKCHGVWMHPTRKTCYMFNHK